MKAILFSLAAYMLSTSTAFAGLTGFDTDSFNSVINESLQAEKELRDSLRKDAGFKKQEKKSSRIIEVASPGRKEVNVPTSFFKDGKKKSENLDLKVEQQNFERLSQELNEVN